MLTLLPPSPAFVIHSREYQEHSLLIEFFTLNHGRVSAIAKRVKTVRSSFKYLLQPFFPLNVSFKQGKSDLWHVYDVEPSGNLLSFAVPEIFCASYLNELLYYLYKSKESDPKLFASYLETLKCISEKISLDKALREFEFALLDSLGYGIRFEDKDGNALQSGCFYHFLPESGFIKISDCKSVSESVEFSEVFSGEKLIMLLNKQYLSVDVLKCAQKITNKALSTLLNNKEIKSRVYYRAFLQSKDK